MHIHNKKKYILILGEGPTQRLDGTTKIADAKYSKNLLFVNTTKLYQFKTRDYEIKICQFYLGNISEDF